ncbi:ComF family protein [Bifidobacterium aquikefiricola]|uniref:Phosphoribosyltransferase family protein n=1 Tax=Bifidobacterium aquikefiricola TaxID=3059038 RepID=A0AB39U3Y6_9BIFI
MTDPFRIRVVASAMAVHAYRASFVRAARRICREVLDIVVPRGCVGCDLPDCVICQRCAASFRYGSTRVFPLALMERSFSSALYRGPVRAAILAWKDHRDEELTQYFSERMAFLVYASSLVDWCHEHAVYSLCIVPMPSSPYAILKRGRMHTLALAQAVAQTLQREGIDAHAQSALRLKFSTTKAVRAVGAAGRTQRLHGKMAVKRSYELNNRHIVLVDDIITTGSTIRACIKMLGTCQAHVVTALTLASTPCNPHRDAAMHER